KGLLPESFKKDIAVTYLAGLFRSVRFGIGEAHGKGVAFQFNYLLEKGAITYDEATGTFAVNFDTFEKWVQELVQEVCILQATGDYAGTRAFFEKYVTMPESLSSALAKLDAVPVDIAPRYTLAEQLSEGTN
ncbi:MAG: hypothetical protein ACE5G1_13030, partial [bacterium]